MQESDFAPESWLREKWYRFEKWKKEYNGHEKL
jgi:hypothetical protein